MQEMEALLRRYLLGIWRKRWLVLAMAWLLCLAGWMAASRVPDQYEASSRIYVDADAVLTPLLRGVALDNTPTNQLEMLQRTLLSRPNMEKLISKTDLEMQVRGPAGLERLTASLASAITVIPQTRNLFTITYRNTNPKLAYDVVQTVLAIFTESKAGTNRADMENARQFLEQQIGLYERKLRAAESKRAEFNSKYLDLLPDGNGGASRLDAARNTVANLTETLKQVQLRLSLAQQQIASTQPTLPGDVDPGTGTVVSQGSATPQSCRELESLRARYTDQHPTVIATKEQCEQDRHSPSNTGTTVAAPRARSIANPIYEKLKLQTFDFEATIAALQQQIADKTKERDRLEAIARGAPGLVAEYTDMARDYDVVRKNYEELLERREAMRIASAADTEAEKVKLEVVDPPQLPRVPVAPNRHLLLTAVLGLGVAGALGMTMMLLQFDTSFYTVEELRHLELPVAGSISLISAAVPLSRRLFAVASFSVVALLLAAVYGGLLWRLTHTGIL